MNPLVVLTAVFAAACAAPADYAAAPVAVAAAPVAYAHAAPVAAHVPAPYTTVEQGPATTTIHEQPAVVTKQLHFGQTQFVSGQTVDIIKPPTPVLPIQVPTVLRGTVQQNAPLVKTVKETHVVNEPVYVERKVHVPYDVPVVKEQIREVPVAVHVDKPYAVPHPVAVPGEPIVNVRQGAPVVHRTHTDVHAAPVVQAVGYAHAAPAAYAHAAPAAYAHAAPAAYAGYGYAAAPVAAIAPAAAVVAEH